mmetsp:Transcript_67702/g.198153  ORF Transcript_67702/g.198153 Transcript_67702/m.198153 type:complete len:204 (+) Transcript_67702:886-1497(+)
MHHGGHRGDADLLLVQVPEPHEPLRRRRRPVPAGHVPGAGPDPGRLHHPGGLAVHRHGHAPRGLLGDGQAPRGGYAPVRRGLPGGHHGGLHRQDRNADRGQDDGRGGRRPVPGGPLGTSDGVFPGLLPPPRRQPERGALPTGCAHGAGEAPHGHRLQPPRATSDFLRARAARPGGGGGGYAARCGRGRVAGTGALGLLLLELL